jgi:hypothetical protein
MIFSLLVGKFSPYPNRPKMSKVYANSYLKLKNRDSYNLAVGLLWKHVVLEDCRTTHTIIEQSAHSDTPPWRFVTDEHDDTPIIQKLLVLAR